MHIELVVPALFPAQDLPPASMPALALLLARGRRSNGEAASLERWLVRAFGVDGSAIPAGALTALAHGMDPGARTWLRADPVHLRPDRDRLLLVPSQAFGVTLEEARQLTNALGPLLSGKLTLHPLAPDQWCLEVKDEIDEGNAIAADAQPPIELAGVNIDPHLPPRAWHALLTELQMALYEHAVNTARERRGDPAINSLWLWGAGKLPAGAAGPWQSLGANDSVAIGLARSAGIRNRAPGAGAAAWFERAPQDGRHLLVLDDLRGVSALGDLEGHVRRLKALEADWFAPLLAALKAGRFGMLTIHAPEAAASFEAVRGDLHRFWRRPRPLAAYA
ncbi:MAG: hypothetical protein ABI654_10165 [Betaproteobacteria bacterium]